VGMIQERLQALPLVVQLPWGTESSFVGVIDLIEMKGLRWEEGMGESWETLDIPEDLQAKAQEWRYRLFEQLADHDEALFEKFVHGQEATPDELRRALRKATLEVTGTPVLCGSAFKNKGIQPLLDAVVAYLPSPVDVPPVTGRAPTGRDEISREASDTQP